MLCKFFPWYTKYSTFYSSHHGFITLCPRIFQDSFLDFSSLSVILDSICTPAINILPTSKPLPSSFFRPIEMDPISLFGGLEQHFTVIWDTGASRPVSAYSTDFVGPILQHSIPLHFLALLLVSQLLASALYSGLSFLNLVAS